MSDDEQRVVITGMGLVSPIGTELDEFWESLVAGKSGVSQFASVPTANLPTSIAAEADQFTGKVQDFGELPKDLKKTIRKSLKVMCRETQMGVAAAQRAQAHAGMEAGEGDPERAGVVFGSDYMLTMPQEFNDGVLKCEDDEGRFEYDRWGSDGLQQMTPLWLLKYLPNMPASHIAINNDLRGPNNSITHREAASNLAIGEAFHTILRGSADRIVSGATGTRVHPMKAVHAAQSEQLADDVENPAGASRPFDLRRKGMVIGEGAGSVVLENRQTALERGAKIYGEVVATASSSVADRNLVARRDTALANAMRSCLEAAQLGPGDIGHINAHGLGTIQCDADEARAIREVFGDYADRLPVVAPKSHFGNLGAGSGTVELIASLLALAQGTLFPVLNYQEPDPECPVHAVTSADVPAGEFCLNLSVTPQGQASVVAIRAAA